MVPWPKKRLRSSLEIVDRCQRTNVEPSRSNQQYVSLLLPDIHPPLSPFTVAENHSTPSTYSHLIDLRLDTTKHIHALKHQLLAFVNNILSAEFFIQMGTIDFIFTCGECFFFADQEDRQSGERIPRLERSHPNDPSLSLMGRQVIGR